MNNFPATSHDKWKIGDPYENEVELTDHPDWCEVWIDGDLEECNCPEGLGYYEEEDNEPTD